MTGPVDPNATADMARLIALMNEDVKFDDDMVDMSSVGDYSDYADYPSSAPTGGNHIAPPLPIINPDVSEMKRILEAFNSTMTDPAARLNDRAVKNRELREALVTETTPAGTRIGSWEIIINEGAKGLKTFDVTNVHTGEPIASGLTLYDAAHGIVSCLNEGGTINSRTVRDILNTEAQYASYRQDAAIFKVRYETATSDHRKAVMEDRYVDALGKTKQARLKLSEIVKPR